jgi:hypothetical protein
LIPNARNFDKSLNLSTLVLLLISILEQAVPPAEHERDGEKNDENSSEK